VTPDWTVLLNRKSGVVSAETHLEQLHKMIGEAGLNAELYPTASTAEMRKTLRELVAKGTPRVAIAGGDGTVAQAVQELAYSETALGILPLGTFNNFAAALRLPGDLPSALQVLKCGTPYPIDLGQAGTHYFTEVAGLGLFAKFIEVSNVRLGKSLWRGLYAAARAVVPLKRHALRLVVDGEVLEDHVIVCALTNTYRVGAAMSVSPGAWLTDGKLEVILVGDVPLNDLPRYARAAWSQMLESLPQVRRLQAEQVQIEGPHGSPVHVDDQFILSAPVTVTARPGALKVVLDGIAGV